MGRIKTEHLPIFLSYLLRHAPQEAGLDMDSHGWVTDDKGRFRFSEDGQRIKACQGHSIPWVHPELELLPPPQFLYHGTTTAAMEKILESGEIKKMSRHAVHLQADARKAWQSAARWKGKIPVVLKIDAAALAETGLEFGKSENGVWCCEAVPVGYIVERIYSAPD